MSGPVALGAYLILLALILIFNSSAHRRWHRFFQKQGHLFGGGLPY